MCGSTPLLFRLDSVGSVSELTRITDGDLLKAASSLSDKGRPLHSEGKLRPWSLIQLHTQPHTQSSAAQGQCSLRARPESSGSPTYDPRQPSSHTKPAHLQPPGPASWHFPFLPPSPFPQHTLLSLSQADLPSPYPHHHQSKCLSPLPTPSYLWRSISVESHLLYEAFPGPQGLPGDTVQRPPTRCQAHLGLNPSSATFLVSDLRESYSAPWSFHWLALSWSTHFMGLREFKEIVHVKHLGIRPGKL